LGDWIIPYCTFDELNQECHNNIDKLLNTPMGKALPLYYWCEENVGYFKEKRLTGKGIYFLHLQRKYNGILQLACSDASKQLMKKFGVRNLCEGGKDFNGFNSIISGQKFYTCGSIIDEKEYVMHPYITLSRAKLLIKREDVECLKREYPDLFCAPPIIPKKKKGHDPDDSLLAIIHALRCLLISENPDLKINENLKNKILQLHLDIIGLSKTTLSETFAEVTRKFNPKKTGGISLGEAVPGDAKMSI